MKIKRINIPIFRYSLTFIEVEDYDDYKIIGKELKRFDLPSETLNEVINNTQHSYDGGITLTNGGKMQIVVIIYKHSSERQRTELINHEKRHVIDDIMTSLGIKDKETPAYLDGYISSKIF